MMIGKALTAAIWFGIGFAAGGAAASSSTTTTVKGGFINGGGGHIPSPSPWGISSPSAWGGGLPGLSPSPWGGGGGFLAAFFSKTTTVSTAASSLGFLGAIPLLAAGAAVQPAPCVGAACVPAVPCVGAACVPACNVCIEEAQKKCDGTPACVEKAKKECKACEGEKVDPNQPLTPIPDNLPPAPAYEAAKEMI
jgi:hypothetical protein